MLFQILDLIGIPVAVAALALGHGTLILGAVAARTGVHRRLPPGLVVDDLQPALTPDVQVLFQDELQGRSVGGKLGLLLQS